MEAKLKIECHRTLLNLNYIYFFKDGNTPWYKAYEWSAYLLEFYNNGLPDDKRLKPIKKTYKCAREPVIQVGFLLTSLQKYIPDINVISKDTNNDKCLIFCVDLSKYNITFENYFNTLTEWKNSVELQKEKNKNIKQLNVFSKPVTAFSIMQSLMAYDTHNKSVDDLRQFIIQMKEKCASLIF